VEITTVPIIKPESVNVILGQAHFIKSVEDLHEALVTSVPGIRFGLAFCEASGACLVRWSATDPALGEVARRHALAIGAGHSFLIVLGDGYYPVNVLNAIKAVPEVCCIFCATANPVQVVIAATEQGRGILGVIDGASPAGMEDEAADQRASIAPCRRRLALGPLGQRADRCLLTHGHSLLRSLTVHGDQH
jgi:adenosine/AMP kinase